MSLFKRFFGKKNKISTEKSNYLPENKAPKELEFARNFTEKGGKFIYCENAQLLQDNFLKILEENQWKPDEIKCNNPVLSSYFNLKSSQAQCVALLAKCEFLISNKGAILVCSEQIQQQKLKELPENLIIVSDTSSFMHDVSEAMSAIKAKYQEKLPTNITTLNTFTQEQENDLLTAGSVAKNLYLLVQEVK